MKKIFYMFFLLLGVGLFAETEKKELNTTTPALVEKELASKVPKTEAKTVITATRGDVKIIEATAKRTV